MDNRNELSEFLTTRRAKITPQQAGVETYGGRRRVQGLRREEVARMAGVSIEYYTRLERGNAAGASDSVLYALGRALQLDDAEQAHLVALARSSETASRARRRPAQQRVRPGLQQLLDAMHDVPAFVQNGRLDILAANDLARALYADLYDDPRREPNHARYTFLDPRAADLYPDWNRAAADTVALLRAETGRQPDDRVLNELIGELSTRSQQFSALWATHNVRWHTTGIKQFHHRVAGDLSLSYEGMDLASDNGQIFVSFTAEPGSTSHQALQFLASWSATHGIASSAAPMDRLQEQTPPTT